MPRCVKSWEHNGGTDLSDNNCGHVEVNDPNKSVPGDTDLMVVIVVVVAVITVVVMVVMW